MIPCQSTCGRYCEGCHKNCAKWKLLQARNILPESGIISVPGMGRCTVLRQFLSMQPHAYYR